VLLAMMFDKIKSIFHKEKWPADKDVKFVLSAKGGRETIMYLSQEQFNILVGLINLGSQVVQMPMVIATMEPKTTQGFMS